MIISWIIFTIVVWCFVINALRTCTLNELSNVRKKFNPLFQFCEDKKYNLNSFKILSESLLLYVLYNLRSILIFGIIRNSRPQFFQISYNLVLTAIALCSLLNSQKTQETCIHVYFYGIISSYIAFLLPLTLPQESWQKSNQVTIVDSDITP